MRNNIQKWPMGSSFHNLYLLSYIICGRQRVHEAIINFSSL